MLAPRTAPQSPRKLSVTTLATLVRHTRCESHFVVLLSISSAGVWPQFSWSRVASLHCFQSRHVCTSSVPDPDSCAVVHVHHVRALSSRDCLLRATPLPTDFATAAALHFALSRGRVSPTDSLIVELTALSLPFAISRGRASVFATAVSSAVDGTVLCEL